jgi:biotin synthase-related radical SAM superfamily protein
MNWTELKAALLEQGTARVSGAPIDSFLERSRAGPGAGGPGSVFFAAGDRRVRLAISPDSPVVIVHKGGGRAELHLGDETFTGRLEHIGLHCPRQAYITVSEGCIFACRYCPVPAQRQHVKTPREVTTLIEGVFDRIDAISITSGVVGSVEEDEERVLAVLDAVRRFDLPIGVSIYPGEGTPRRLFDRGVAEVKFNLETATPALFTRMCPGLDRDVIWDALSASVPLFGKNHVFSNVILGLGETDEEMRACIDKLAAAGIIPVIRPLTPAAGLADRTRPGQKRLLELCSVHEKLLKEHGLDTLAALTMCTACTGCDLVPGRDT